MSTSATECQRPISAWHEAALTNTLQSVGVPGPAHVASAFVAGAWCALVIAGAVAERLAGAWADSASIKVQAAARSIAPLVADSAVACEAGARGCHISAARSRVENKCAGVAGTAIHVHAGVGGIAPFVACPTAADEAGAWCRQVSAVTIGVCNGTAGTCGACIRVCIFLGKPGTQHDTGKL